MGEAVILPPVKSSSIDTWKISSAAVVLSPVRYTLALSGSTKQILPASSRLTDSDCTSPLPVSEYARMVSVCTSSSENCIQMFAGAFQATGPLLTPFSSSRQSWNLYDWLQSPRGLSSGQSASLFSVTVNMTECTAARTPASFFSLEEADAGESAVDEVAVDGVAVDGAAVDGAADWRAAPNAL